MPPYNRSGSRSAKTIKNVNKSAKTAATGSAVPISRMSKSLHKKTINTPGTKYKITLSKDRESEFEAYHSVFSRFSSTENIYKKLAKLCGATFAYFTDPKNPRIPNKSIFCESADETHYRYKDKNGIVHDPYEHFQMNKSHGNCLFFALYFAYCDKFGSLDLLIDLSTSGLIKDETKNGHTYKKTISTEKQLAYQCFVYNDYKIIEWVTDLIVNKYSTLGPIYEQEWKSEKPKDKKSYGIPVNTSYTFKIFFDKFKDLIANGVETTYKMTYDQAMNWDTQAIDHYAYENSGIENGVIEENYELPQPIPIKIKYLGGNKNKNKNKNKTNTKKNLRNKRTRKISRN